LIVFVAFATSTASAQDQSFYRFQYHKFFWKAYHSDKYHLYFPANAADSIFKHVVKEMPLLTARVKKSMIKDIPKDLNIILYPSIDQQYETNIGSFELGQLTFPTFASKGKRVVVAYAGSYESLSYNLVEGLARSIWENDFKEDANKGDKTEKEEGNIPPWFKEGAIRFFAHGMPIEAEDNLHGSLTNRNFKSWDEVLAYSPRLGGQAFCYFLSDKCFPLVVAQTTFQLKKKRDIKRALRLVTKHSLDTLFAQCFAYYQKRYNQRIESATSKEEEQVFEHAKGVIQQVSSSSNGRYVVYTTLYKGARTVYLHDFNTHDTKKLCKYKLPPWLSEHTSDKYPLLSWNREGNQLYITKPRKGVITIHQYSVEGKLQEKMPLYSIDGVNEVSVLPANQFLLSAFRNGQSDIVKYDHRKERFYPYMDDEYDDSNPTLIDSTLYFISNRPKEYVTRRIYLIGVGYKKDTLWQGLYRQQDGKVEPLLIDTVGYVRYNNLVKIDENHLLLTTTKRGVEEDAVYNIQDGTLRMLGSHSTIQLLDDQNVVHFSMDADSVHLHKITLDVWLNKPVISASAGPWLVDYLKRKKLAEKEDSLLASAKDTTHYFMDDLFAPQPEKTKGKKKKAVNTHGNQAVPYVLQLHSAYFTAQVNNDYFINRFEPYRTYQGQYKYPELTALTKGGFTDLFENHHFNIAYGLPTSTDGSLFFAKYENTARNIDWGLDYYRKVEMLKPDSKSDWVDENGNKYPTNAKVKTHFYELFLRRPLTYYSAITLQTSVRNDRTVFLATDKYSLDFASLESTWSINTLSYRTRKLSATLPLLYKGYEFKGTLDLCEGAGTDKGYVFAAGISGSYYLPLYKYITLVTQLHMGYSDGDRYILYNLGGKDNNLTPRIDSSVHFSQSAPYAFSNLVTPLRGYLQNSLFGSRYALLNYDLYFPLFRTLIPVETPLPFINNLQPGLLFDLAAAREDWNSLDKGRVVTSYGISARSKLAGYPIRFDIAWPGTFAKKPVWYLSLNLL
jgi:hypothetical protein